jgi:hypothetical protein
MSDSINDFLRPPQFASLLGLSERQARNVAGQLEALGFKLTPDSGGVRLIPPGLAAAVKIARQQKKDLAALRLDPAAARYLAPGAATDELDPLALLIHVATEVVICREVVGNMAVAMSTGVAAQSWKPFSWTNAGLPDARTSL